MILPGSADVDQFADTGSRRAIKIHEVAKSFSIRVIVVAVVTTLDVFRNNIRVTIKNTQAHREHVMSPSE